MPATDEPGPITPGIERRAARLGAGEPAGPTKPYQTNVLRVA